MLISTLRQFAIALLAVAGLATPALASECPAGQVATNTLAGPTMPMGVTDTVKQSGHV